MKKIVAMTVYICIFIIFSLPASANHQTELNIEDAKYSDFKTTLDGQWLYFEHQLLTPQRAAIYYNIDAGHVVSVPHKFKMKTGTAQGYATYVTKLKLPKHFIGKRLTINIPFQYSAYQFYVNERLAMKNGVVGVSKKTSRQRLAPKNFSFTVPENQTILLTMQISNFDNIRGGFEKSVTIGNDKIMNASMYRQLFLYFFLFGSISLMAIFSILFSLFRRQDRVYLVFGLFCLSIVFRGLFAEPYLYTLILDPINWLVASKIAYVSAEISIFLYIVYVAQYFKNSIPKRFLQYNIIISIAMVIVTIISAQQIYQFLFSTVYSTLFLVYFYMLYCIIRKISWKDQNAVLTLIGMFIVFIGGIHDIYVVITSPNSTQYSFVLLGVFVAIQSFIFCRYFAKQWLKVEELNEELLQLNTTLDDKIQIRTQQLVETNIKLQKLAYLDGLTGAFNRHFFNKNLKNLFYKNKETGECLSVIIIDVDEFKRYNDYYGHVKGDALLKRLVEVLVDNLPLGAQFVRYGGEEFAVLLDNIQRDEAYAVAEKLRACIEEQHMEHKGRQFGEVTISVGGTTLCSNNYEDELELLSEADRQLYLAKTAGRNRVFFN
ncbi:sensor domain-containing diguanylate cyclase [Kurthia sibirica]|uniref:GGDEF domain-containing protein n=1 Tax=Kurthia sibirica TaxID=202750 RepID=A0A2U3AP68_9BACL|nr:diguanylate cyclase [Kurthia sibirica]PWI26299.1 hypothetical protein DEX24_02900 [Kurthia sibirica]GEK35032.1 diguanylate cyclase [Kurthia sibirica]